MRILIVDDHTLVREGVMRLLRELISPPPDFVEAGSGPDAMALASRERFDVVLLDISLPGRNGIDVLRQLRMVDPDLPILMLSMHPDEQYAVRALRAGASGYVTKDSASNELTAAIDKVMAGKRYVNATQAELLAEAIHDGSDDRPSHHLLSDREYQLVCLMSEGKTMTEIAEELSLSIKTVSTYRTRVLEKLRLRTNADIISYSLRHKLTR